MVLPSSGHAGVAGLAPSATHLDTGRQHQLYIPNIGESEHESQDKLFAQCDFLTITCSEIWATALVDASQSHVWAHYGCVVAESLYM